MKKKFFRVFLLSALVLIPLTVAGQEIPLIQRGGLAECIKDGSCTVEQIFVLANNIIEVLVGITGALALFMYVIGGIWMIFSAGSSSRVERGKDILIGTTIALIFVLGSWVMVSFTLKSLNVKEEFQLNEYTCDENRTCPARMTCINNRCVNLCTIDHPRSGTGFQWSCQPMGNCGIPSWDLCGTAGYENCEKNKCERDEFVCCYQEQTN